MTDYIINTHVMIPEDIVRDIVSDYASRLLAELGDLELSERVVSAIATRMDKAADAVCKDARVSVGGYHLDGKQTLEIASHLRNGKKISAIKEFRSCTGAGLKDSKNFIDTFCELANHQSGPVSAIKFAMAFGR